MSVVGTYLRLSRAERALVHELVLELVRARWDIAWTPFREIARGLGVRGEATDESPLDGRAELLRSVKMWLHVLARRLPWDCACLVRALAARRVLGRRGVPSTLYLGVARGGRGASPDVSTGEAGEGRGGGRGRGEGEREGEREREREEAEGRSGLGTAFRAHAWLRCGDVFVTGGRERLAFTEIECFGHEGGEGSP